MIKRLVLTFSLIFTSSLGLWAYKTNYASRSALLRVDSINKQIAHERYQSKILNAEWEFLNRPERLRKLVEYYFDELRLIPISPQNFTSYDRVTVVNDISIKTTEVENVKIKNLKKD
tara:strand:+ start:1919 stop:2269 length:351 start_codon:yes stop_codon:yes gene_type:complete